MSFEQKRNYILLTLGFGILMFSFCGVQQYIGLYISRSLGLVSLIILYLTFGLGSLLFTPKIVSFFGYKTCLTLAPWPFMAYIIALPTGNIFIIGPAAFLVGLASGPLWAAGYLCLKNNSPDHLCGRLSGLFYSIYGAGACLGILFLGLWSTNVSFTIYFVIYGSICIITIILFQFITKPEAPKEIPVSRGISPKKFSFSNPYLVRASLTSFMAYAIFGIVVAQIPALLKSFQCQNLTWSTAIFFLFPALLSRVVGQMSDRLGRIRLIQLAYFLSSLGIIVLLFSPGPGVTLGGLLLLTLAFTILQPSFTLLQFDISPRGMEDQVSGFFLFSRNLGMVTAILLTLQFSPAFSLFVLVCLQVGCLLTMVQFPETRLLENKKLVQQSFSVKI